ncbi:SCO family protein [Abyssicoccus albus]|uniref:Protein SCO1/2 n=1 Tax=Abyssicoccus albus TaxID=1817405 RepID=A0A3N5BN03_9BACL|nr:SCO family protein [Abyssicoccus albus]RPF57939.1 protein SCO1/2 [Abyssicoccus albus]
MKKIIFITITAILLLTACNQSRIEIAPGYGNVVEDFEVTNQNNKKFSEEDLKGTVTLVDFIFTNCETVCPPMTHNMASVSDQLEEEGITDYQIVSFSVDPENDKPKNLKEYIKKYNVPDDKWSLVTGYDYDFIRSFAEHNFKTIVAPPPESSDQVTHGTSFYLLDQEGKVIKTYSGIDSGDKKFPQEEIVLDVKTVINEGPM